MQQVKDPHRKVNIFQNKLINMIKLEVQSRNLSNTWEFSSMSITHHVMCSTRWLVRNHSFDTLSPFNHSATSSSPLHVWNVQNRSMWLAITGTTAVFMFHSMSATRSIVGWIQDALNRQWFKSCYRPRSERNVFPSVCLFMGEGVYPSLYLGRGCGIEGDVCPEMDSPWLQPRPVCILLQCILVQIYNVWVKPPEKVQW